MLVVESRRDGELRLRSRSLRCDAGYCAAAVVVSIEALAGVKRVKADLGHADPSLTISFDATRIGEQALVQAAITALENIEDPVYQSALQVTYLDPAR